MRDQGTTQTHYDPDTGYVRPVASDEPPATAVVEAVADATDSPPEDLPETLYDAATPRALNRLFAQRSDRREKTGAVAFRFCRCMVTFADDESVVVQPIAEE